MSAETHARNNLEVLNERRAETIRPVLADLTRLRESAGQIESLYGHALIEIVDTMSELLEEELAYLQNPSANHKPTQNQEAHDALIKALSGLNREHFNK
jgi:hypothetical protein